MLRINGEVTNFIGGINFENKEQLMERLRSLRKKPNLLPNCDYRQFYDMIGIAIQQAYYTNPNQIMRYKKYCDSRIKTGVNYGKTEN